MQPARIRRTRREQLMRMVLANKAARMPAAIAGLAVTAFLVGALLPTGQKAARSGPVTALSSKVASKSVLHVVKTDSNAVKPAALVSTSRRSVSFYTGDVRASMFSEPVAPAPPAPASITDIRPIRPAPVDPFADWNYTGTATIGDDTIAILENINTHDGILLRMGDKFLGTKVTSIDGNLLTFGSGATSKSLFISMNTSYIPLSASAAFLTAKSPQPATPANNMQALLASLMGKQKSGAGAAAGGPSVTLPNGKGAIW